VFRHQSIRIETHEVCNYDRWQKFVQYDKVTASEEMNGPPS
jgi:hypothetical protein